MNELSSEILHKPDTFSTVMAMANSTPPTTGVGIQNLRRTDTWRLIKSPSIKTKIAIAMV